MQALPHTIDNFSSICSPTELDIHSSIVTKNAQTYSSTIGCIRFVSYYHHTQRQQASSYTITVCGVFATGNGNGNGQCAQWCAANFHQYGKQCTSLAAKGQGPCYDCGPRSSNPAKKLCDGHCKDTSSDNWNCGKCYNRVCLYFPIQVMKNSICFASGAQVRLSSCLTNTNIYCSVLVKPVAIKAPVSARIPISLNAKAGAQITARIGKIVANVESL